MELKKYFVSEVARPLSAEEGVRLGFFKEGDIWKNKHYLIEIPDSVKEEKLRLARELEKRGVSEDFVDATKKVYLGDYLKDLGDNCVFDKSATGCGGTTLVLEDNRNTIIAMPLTPIIRNKSVIRDPLTHEIVGENPDIYGFYYDHPDGNDRKEKFRAYLQERMMSGKPIKVCTTYFQIKKLVDWIIDITGTLGSECNPYYLYIDEMQDVYKSFGIQDFERIKNEYDRRRGIKEMLKCLPLFEHIIVLSATIMAEKYFFDQIRDFKVYHVKFPEGATEERGVDLCQTETPEKEVINRMEKYLNGNIEENAHVFFNSVRGILSIVRRLNILKNCDKIRIICGEGNAEDKKNSDKIRKILFNAIKKEHPECKRVEDIPNFFALHPGLAEWYVNPIGDINGKPKKVNFYTARIFGGVDIYDRHSQIYLVTSKSDEKKTNEVFDILTDYDQAVGRIRNCISTPIYIYRRNSYYDSPLSEEQRKKDKEDMLELARKNLRLAKDFGESKLNRLDLTYDEDTNDVTENVMIKAMNDSNRESLKRLSARTTVTLEDGFKDRGFKVGKVEIVEMGMNDEVREITDKVTSKAYSRITFKRAYQAYKHIADAERRGAVMTAETKAAKQFFKDHFPDIERIYTFVPENEMESCDYDYKVLQSKSNKHKECSLEEQIRADLDNIFVVGQTYRKEMKKSATDFIKKKYGLKSFKLSGYYEIERVRVRIVTGYDIFGNPEIKWDTSKILIKSKNW